MDCSPDAFAIHDFRVYLGMTEAMHAVIQGLVQGVGFRWFVLRNAEALGLCGWVRNRPDGSVEVLAHGPRAALEQLLRDLRVGPRSAHVRDVRVDWPSVVEQCSTFEVR